MTSRILKGENTRADRNSPPAAVNDLRVVRQNDDLAQDWWASLRTPIEIGLILLRIIEIVILVA